MNLKLLVFLLNFILYLPTTYTRDASDDYAIHPSSYPYLALIEIKQDNGASHFYNGVFVSLKLVMTSSPALAQEPQGKPRNDSFLVYGGLASFQEIGSAPKQTVKKIVTELEDIQDNKYFPNLVLLLLKSPFVRSSTLGPAVFNVGMLSPTSLMVGWAFDVNTLATLSHPVAFPVRCLSSTQCSEYALVEFKEQFCSASQVSQSENFHLLEGALLVDRGRYITGLLQFTSYFKMRSGMLPSMVLVRLSYFKDYWQFHEVDSKEEFLHTNFNDDIEVEHWFSPDATKGAESSVFSLWTYLLDFLVLFFLHLLQRNCLVFI